MGKNTQSIPPPWRLSAQQRTTHNAQSTSRRVSGILSVRVKSACPAHAGCSVRLSRPRGMFVRVAVPLTPTTPRRTHRAKGRDRSPSCPWPAARQDIEKMVLGLPASATTSHPSHNHEPLLARCASRPCGMDAGGFFGDLAGLPRGNNIAQLKYMARRPKDVAARERILQNEGFSRQNKRPNFTMMARRGRTSLYEGTRGSFSTRQGVKGGPSFCRLVLQNPCPPPPLHTTHPPTTRRHPHHTPTP